MTSATAEQRLLHGGSRAAAVAAAAVATVNRASTELRRVALRIVAASIAAARMTRDHQEFHGAAVAVVLAIAVIGYGGLLTVFWRVPSASGVTRVTARPPATEQQALSTPAVPVNEAHALAQAPDVTPPAPPATAATLGRRSALAPSARTLNALWQRRDTRSLDQAFTMLRRDTLAFHRCGMRVTSDNRAVARCDGVATAVAANGVQSLRAAVWNIEFQRSGGRWLITRVTAR